MTGPGAIAKNYVDVTLLRNLMLEAQALYNYIGCS